MKLLPITPAKSLNKAYLKQSLKRDQIELFKDNLVRLFERIRSDEHEEHLKNIVSDFLKDTWYKPTFEINTSKRTDLVIHTGKSSDDPVGVIIETKNPSNRSEMISFDRPNAKALHELLHYYMQERDLRDNKEIKQLITECIQKILANPDSPNVTHLEAEIDRLDYEFYGLTEDEIALVEGRN